MIRAEDVADLREGDVVELRWPNHPDVVVSGPLRPRGGGQWVGPIPVIAPSGDMREGIELAVVSRAPRLYVNHPRTEPEPGDVVRNADGGVLSIHWIYMGSSWLGGRHGTPFVRGELPARLRLLVDGTTGQVVPDLAEVWDEGFEAGHHWWNVGMSGIPHDPPRNPYETGQVVP